MLLIVDIDGTVADFRHRYSKAPKPPHGDKAAFQEWLDKTQSHRDVLEDQPVPLMKNLLQTLDDTHSVIVYLTGRSESYRTVTQAWLRLHEFPHAPLFMRKDNDWRKPVKYKEEQVKKIKLNFGDRFMALDDDYDGDCAEMYRRLGGTHLKVTTCFEK